MKKLFTLLAVMALAMAQTAISQDINLKFTGVSTSGTYVRLDSVLVQSVSRSWSEMLVYPDTVLTFQQTGIAEAQGAAADITAYPNPANGATNVSVTMLQSGEATMQLYTLAGQRVADRTVALQAGENHFEVRLQNAQVYLLAVTTAQGRSTVKLLNRGAGAENSISYLGNSNVVEKRQSANPFQSGDVLKITGFATHNCAAISSREVQQQQTTSKTFMLFFTLPVAPVVAPTVTTNAASSITSTTATSGGNVTSDGGSAVIARGVCWSTSQNPTISGSYTTDGSGTGSFTSSLTRLTPGTTYYVRAYATNAAGTAYGNQITFTTAANAPTVVTTAASSITSTTATTGGNVTSDGGSAVTARGVCWSTSQNPTVSGSHTTDGTGTGGFTSSLTGLTAGTTYYVRAYATNAAGTAYGNQITFTTAANAPTVVTTAASSITSTTATTGGNVTSTGGSAVTARGVCWGTSQNPTISGSHTTDGTGTGSFTSNLTSLTPGTTYYVRAYATNAAGTAYGSQITFTTAANAPTVVTTAASSITSTTATTGGNVTSDGGSAVTARGVCWSTSQNPTISGNHTTDGSGTGSFTSSITGLTAGTTYYVRAYATNAVGTAYGSQITFTTTALPPTVTTTAASNITSTTATSGGNVTSAGSSAVTARGVCWSTSQNPTVRGNHTTNGSGTGSFTSSITGLTPATTYYVRAYAISSVDTAYGSQITFTTSAVVPTVTTTAASNITSTTATSGGNVTSAGSSAVTARGVCWSTSQNPTVRGNHTTDGSGTGSFTSNITGLTAGTTYYVRAYAISAVDTAYGSQITFTTSAVAPTVTTTAASNITSTTATSGGNVISTGGAAVTARGVCWSTSQNPTISGNHTADGSGTGSFTSSITGLTPGTTYYVRAYATNTAGTAYGSQITFITALPNNVFSTAAGTYVYFSPGNLQWSAKNGGTTAVTHAVAGGGTAAGAWRFAAHQWDTIGRANRNASSSYSGWIDMFGWGTSGYNNKYPYMTSTTTTDYGNGAANISGTNYDWGVYNAIYNPKTSTTDAPGTWRALSNNEWVYLTRTRTTPSGIRYAKAQVNGINGLILVPDNWSTSTYAFTSTNTSSAAFTTNVINAATWTTLENAGCVFLPAAGYRSVTTVYSVGTNDGYWSSTYYDNAQAYYMYFYSSVLSQDYVGRNYGYSVRLVKDYNNGQVAQFPTVTTTAASNITSSTATGGGNVTSAGSSSVTARGVCWSTSQNPTISDNHTTNSSGTGSFTSSITGLASGTTYYVRAYATNAAGTAYGNQITFTTTAHTFSVSANTSVLFSPGNLQWSAKNGGSTATTHTVAGGGTAAGTWRFAPNQWDTIGANNRNISSSYSGWIDLFGWGTSGYHDPGDQYNTNYQPYSISTSTVDPNNNYYGYGPSAYMTNIDLSGSNYDWGVYNAIYNPKTTTTDAPGTWRTLTETEWMYLIRTRSTTSGIRYAKAQVNGINGLILVPDNWSTSTYVLNSTNTTGSAYTSNVISAAQWTILENAGAIFLPAAGSRTYVSVGNVGSEGYYWSASNCGFAAAWQIGFYSGNVINVGPFRYGGTSVRLVKNAN